MTSKPKVVVGEMLVSEIHSPVKEIKQVAESAKPDIDEFMNCGYINRGIQAGLTEAGFEAELVVGGIWKTRSQREEHAYLKLTKQDNDSLDTDIIVDGAIKQFCEENKPDVWVTLGEKEQLPSVAVLTPTDDWFAYFLQQQP